MSSTNTGLPPVRGSTSRPTPPPPHPTRPTGAARFPRSPQGVAGIALSLDGRPLAVGYHDTVILYDITDPAHPSQLTPLPAHPTKVPAHTSMDMRFAPDGRTLTTAGGT